MNGNWPGYDWRKAIKLASYAPSPFGKSETVEKAAKNTKSETWLALARVWNWISCIVIAYFVYQTIQSFRKFGKKS